MMVFSTLWKILAAWLLMLIVAIANGAARDLVYGQSISELAAHQLSSLTGILLLGAVIFAFVRFGPIVSERQAVTAGLLWLALTVAFEFLFFHFIGGHSWAELLANYNVLKGRLWPFVLLWVGLAPWLFFRLSRL
jgi:hypothetical protein